MCSVIFREGFIELVMFTVSRYLVGTLDRHFYNGLGDCHKVIVFGAVSAWSSYGVRVELMIFVGAIVDLSRFVVGKSIGMWYIKNANVFSLCATL